MRRANVVSGVVLALFGMIMLFAVIPSQIDRGPASMVSARLVPNITMIVVTVLAGLLIVTNLRAPDDGVQETSMPVTWAEIAALAKIGAVFAVSLGLYLAVSPLAAGAGLTVGSLLVLGERRLFVLVLMPAALLLALWVLFYKVLGTAIV